MAISISAVVAVAAVVVAKSSCSYNCSNSPDRCRHPKPWSFVAVSGVVATSISTVIVPAVDVAVIVAVAAATTSRGHSLISRYPHGYAVAVTVAAEQSNIAMMIV